MRTARKEKTERWKTMSIHESKMIVKEAEKQNLSLCKLLHEEAERKYPKHQRCINMMKMKKFQSESSSEFLRRIRKNLEVAEVSSMTAEEFGIHIFIESSVLD